MIKQLYTTNELSNKINRIKNENNVSTFVETYKTNLKDVDVIILENFIKNISENFIYSCEKDDINEEELWKCCEWKLVYNDILINIEIYKEINLPIHSTTLKLIYLESEINEEDINNILLHLTFFQPNKKQITKTLSKNQIEDIKCNGLDTEKVDAFLNYHNIKYDKKYDKIYYDNDEREQITYWLEPHNDKDRYYSIVINWDFTTFEYASEKYNYVATMLYETWFPWNEIDKEELFILVLKHMSDYISSSETSDDSDNSDNSDNSDGEN